MMKNTIYSIAIVLGIYSQEMEAEEKQPNIVFIMADDLGWTDLGVMGSDYYLILIVSLRRECFLRMRMLRLQTLHLAGLV